jgi:hypothetical protein
MLKYILPSIIEAPYVLSASSSFQLWPNYVKCLFYLSKNTPAEKQLLMDILKAMENVGAHKVTGQKQGASFFCC